MLVTAEPPSWTSQFREFIESVDAKVEDVSGMDDLLHRDDYAASQVFGAERHGARSSGITWPSVRFAGGNCIAAFWTDVVPIVVQGAHFAYL